MTGTRQIIRSQQDKYGRNYRDPILSSLTKHTANSNRFNNNGKNNDREETEPAPLVANRQIQKAILIDDRIPRDKARTKTIYLGDNVSWNQVNFAINRKMFGKVVDIIADNFSANNVNETIFRIRINTGAIINVRGYKLL